MKRLLWLVLPLLLVTNTFAGPPTFDWWSTTTSGVPVDSTDATATLRVQLANAQRGSGFVSLDSGKVLLTDSVAIPPNVELRLGSQVTVYYTLNDPDERAFCLQNGSKITGNGTIVVTPEDGYSNSNGSMGCAIIAGEYEAGVGSDGYTGWVIDGPTIKSNISAGNGIGIFGDSRGEIRNVHFQSSDSMHTAILAHWSFDASTGWTNHPNNIKISNITVDTLSYTGSRGVGLSGCFNVEVSNVVVHKNRKEAFWVYAGDSGYVKADTFRYDRKHLQGQGITFANVKAYDCYQTLAIYGDDAFDSTYAMPVVVNQMVAYGNPDSGYTTRGNAIHLANVDGVVIQNSEFYRFARGWAAAETNENVSFINNVFADMSYMALSISYSAAEWPDNILVQNNRIYNCAASGSGWLAGIQVNYAKRVYLVGNRIGTPSEDSIACGIHVYNQGVDSLKVVVVDNFVEGWLNSGNHYGGFRFDALPFYQHGNNVRPDTGFEGANSAFGVNEWPLLPDSGAGAPDARFTSGGDSVVYLTTTTKSFGVGGTGLRGKGNIEYNSATAWDTAQMEVPAGIGLAILNSNTTTNVAAVLNLITGSSNTAYASIAGYRYGPDSAGIKMYTEENQAKREALSIEPSGRTVFHQRPYFGRAGSGDSILIIWDQLDSAVAAVGGGDITGVTAGDGLTGGGDVATVTLNVVGGIGLTDNADSVYLDTAYLNDWKIDSARVADSARQIAWGDIIYSTIPVGFQDSTDDGGTTANSDNADTLGHLMYYWPNGDTLFIKDSSANVLEMKYDSAGLTITRRPGSSSPPLFLTPPRIGDPTVADSAAVTKNYVDNAAAGLIDGSVTMPKLATDTKDSMAFKYEIAESLSNAYLDSNAFVDSNLYMDADASQQLQYIYFSDDGSAGGSWIRFDTLNDRFQTADPIYIGEAATDSIAATHRYVDSSVSAGGGSGTGRFDDSTTYFVNTGTNIGDYRIQVVSGVYFWFADSLLMFGNPAGTYDTIMRYDGSDMTLGGQGAAVFSEGAYKNTETADSQYVTKNYADGLSGTGEVNTLADTGTADGVSAFGLTQTKAVAELRIRQLLEGSNVTLAYDGDTAISITAAGGAPGANSIDSTHVIANSLSMPSDLAAFTESELEGRLSDVTALFTNNATGDVTISGGTSTLGANTVDSTNVTNGSISMSADMHTFTEAELEAELSDGEVVTEAELDAVTGDVTFSSFASTLGADKVDSTHVVANSLSMSGDMHTFTESELEGQLSDVTAVFTNNVTGDVTVSGGTSTLGANTVDSTNITAGSVSMSGDLHTFTEAELEGQLSDVTALFTNNVTGAVTVSGGTSSLGVNTVDSTQIIQTGVGWGDLNAESKDSIRIGYTGGSGTADSMGVDTDGDGTVDARLYSTAAGGAFFLKKGSNITLSVDNDTVTIAAAGGAPGANTIDSTHVIANSLSMSGDMHTFTESELEAQTSDVTAYFTNNVTGDVTVSGGTSAIGANVVDSGDIVADGISLPTNVEEFTEAELESNLSDVTALFTNNATGDVTISGGTSTLGANTVDSTNITDGSVSMSADMHTFTEAELEAELSDAEVVTEAELDAVTGDVTFSAFASTLGADKVDSTNVVAGSISMSGDVHTFTESELEGQLSDVTAVFTDNVTGDVTVSGGTSTLGANTVDSTNVVAGSISMSGDVHTFTESELETQTSDVTAFFTNNVTGDVTVAGGTSALGANTVDSTNVTDGSISMSADMHTFTEAELEAELSDVTDIRTNNDIVQMTFILDDPAADDTLILPGLMVGYTIDSVVCVTTGGTSITYMIEEAGSNGGAGTDIAGSDFVHESAARNVESTFTNAAIDAEDVLRVVVTSVSGTVSSATISVRYHY